MKRIAFVSLIVLLASSFHYINNGTLTGNYRLKYKGKYTNKYNGWDLDQQEELLSLYSDSTYTLKRIYAHGGFEIIPDTGKWVFTNLKIVLTSNSEYITYKRYFKIADNGIKEQHCKEKRFSNILWVKDQITLH